jgi:glycosyltransferase involved in cell wall biosynthesis
MPSQYEGFALTYSEAMIAGTPVIVTCRSGNAALLRPFRPGADNTAAHGWLIDPEDPRTLVEALESALAHRDLLPRMGQAAAAFARAELTWQRNAERVLELFAR